MSRVAIIAAMAGELKPFLDANAKDGWVHERRGNVQLWRLIWPLGQGEWVAACAGAGQQAATRAFAEVEKDGPIDRVISTGWAGALSGELRAGKAYRVGGVIDEQTGERFPVPDCPDEPWLITSSRVADAAEKQRLAQAFTAGLVDMEAAAIARLAASRGVPFHCIKGVSDSLTDNLPDFSPFLSSQGQLQMARLLFYVLPRPWRWPALMRMGENSSKAAQAIRTALLEDLDKPGAGGKQNGNTNLKD
jgi:adenosylhomocysteine nucleosidase